VRTLGSGLRLPTVYHLPPRCSVSVAEGVRGCDTYVPCGGSDQECAVLGLTALDQASAANPGVALLNPVPNPGEPEPARTWLAMGFDIGQECNGLSFGIDRDDATGLTVLLPRRSRYGLALPHDVEHANHLLLL
jgi:hypothetical protein